MAKGANFCAVANTGYNLHGSRRKSKEVSRKCVWAFFDGCAGAIGCATEHYTSRDGDVGPFIIGIQQGCESKQPW